MSGGHFDYRQYNISDIANEIEHLIETNNDISEWGYSRDYNLETIEEFKTAVKLLRTAAIYVQRIDWLVSADDGEDTFHRRIKEDMTQLNEGHSYDD